MDKKDKETIGCANCANCMFSKSVHKVQTKKERSSEDKRRFVDVVVGEYDALECRANKPWINGFPEVKPNDFCGCHVNSETGVQTFGKYIVKA